MFDITKLILKIPNFLTHKECDNLINDFETNSLKSYTESSKNYQTNKVESSDCKIVILRPYTESFNLIKEKTKVAVNSYLEYLDKPKYFFTSSLKNSLKFSHSYRIIKYEVGGSIHPHIDHDLGVYGSISYNLNDDYEGGEFYFFNQKYKVNLQKGDALIFPADYFWIHEITPVTKGVRYSLNSFLSSYPHIVKRQISSLGSHLNNDYIRSTPPEELLGPYN